MTKAQEIELAIRAKAGDQTAITMLYKQYIPMMAQYCRKYRKLNTLTQEDLMQYCAIYFLQTIEKFDPSKNNKFGTMLLPQLQQLHRAVTYDDFILRRPVQQGDKDNRTEYSSLSINAQLDDGGDYADMYEDFDARFWEDAENAEENVQIMQIVKSELASLDPLERTVVELKYYGNIKQVHIAKFFNISPDKVKFILRDFRAGCRERIAKL